MNRDTRVAPAEPIWCGEPRRPGTQLRLSRRLRVFASRLNSVVFEHVFPTGLAKGKSPHDARSVETVPRNHRKFCFIQASEPTGSFSWARWYPLCVGQDNCSRRLPGCFSRGRFERTGNAEPAENPSQRCLPAPAPSPAGPRLLLQPPCFPTTSDSGGWTDPLPIRVRSAAT